jgi:hypothetical protein
LRRQITGKYPEKSKETDWFHIFNISSDDLDKVQKIELIQKYLRMFLEAEAGMTAEAIIQQMQKAAEVKGRNLGYTGAYFRNVYGANLYETGGNGEIIADIVCAVLHVPNFSSEKIVKFHWNLALAKIFKEAEAGQNHD